MGTEPISKYSVRHSLLNMHGGLKPSCCSTAMEHSKASTFIVFICMVTVGTEARELYFDGLCYTLQKITFYIITTIVTTKPLH